MARDILSGFGSDYRAPREPLPHSGQTHDGGKPTVKPTDYSAPVGPSNINDAQTPGLHGTNHGNCGSQK